MSLFIVFFLFVRSLLQGYVIDASSPNTYFFEEDRDFRLFVPTNWRTYQDPVSLPLVVCLHGTGGNAEGASGEYYMGFSKVSDDRNDFIALFPEGVVSVFLTDFMQCVSPSTNCQWHEGIGDTSRLDNAGYLDDLIQSLATYPIVNKITVDLDNVYITGHSSGGFMTYYYARNNGLPNGVRGIAPYAGHDNMYGGTTPPSHVHVLHIHGDADPIVPLEPAYASYVWEVEFWLGNNQCPSTDYAVKEVVWDFHDGNDYIVKLEKFSNVNPCPDDGKVRGMIWIGQNHDWPVDYSWPVSEWPVNGETLDGFAVGSTNFADLIWMQMKDMTNIQCIPRCLHGDCVSNTCTNCEFGWIGDYCSKPDESICDPECGTNEYCDGANGCKCFEGWTGDECDEPLTCFGEDWDDEMSVCNGRGTCESKDKCTCFAGYSGDSCQNENSGKPPKKDNYAVAIGLGVGVGSLSFVFIVLIVAVAAVVIVLLVLKSRKKKEVYIEKEMV